MSVTDLSRRILEVLDEQPDLSDIEVSQAIFGADAGYHYLAVYGEIIRLKDARQLAYRASGTPGILHWYRMDEEGS
ncbi:MAG: hypothetical protein CVV05_01035 [Gammaproteobacteria bacterium HGW-Gammaproteobacteria-1]|jgi:hypothetical protein|nr:MAG: hypothetical protein CVV05_01035 [Gammaproteobacteria bacterium HGW-Gammaproteobacteria-1]